MDEDTRDFKRIVRDGYNQIAQAHHDWAQTVRAQERWRYTQRVLDALPEGAAVLDLGCGSGVPTTQALASRFDVTGIDISESQIALARRNVPAARFLVADITQLDLPAASLDGVTAFYSLIHVPRDEQPALLRAIASWLRPRGLLVASCGPHDLAVDYTPSFFGAPMFWSGFDTETYLHLMTLTGLETQTAVQETAIEFGQEITFLWIVARKPLDAVEKEAPK
jgi:SAM-dependent methyltransferase